MRATDNPPGGGPDLASAPSSAGLSLFAAASIDALYLMSALLIKVAGTPDPTPALEPTPVPQGGVWVADSVGWWYRYADGSYPAGHWIGWKWYYFNESGQLVG